ncbi:uncharacterized protein EMH_0032950 [Eimeria mitis]|uniref:Uncharacterized protein n=1 Tax=Eimeria mitis TaxID=44415 RepID=U6JQ32_9EIME|nr:uncharacterized protein EMH_0032950 [Eimeria mitis]CDJ27569.1 hypothetical protein, conserved [Eimeria mitis]
MQALTRLSFFPLPVIQLWCSSVEGEMNLLRSVRDAMTCVFPLSLAVYIHPVLFSRAFRFVESRYSRDKPRNGLLASDRHLEPLFLSHLCWAFLVAEMHRRPFFLTLLDRALALSPPPTPQLSPPTPQLSPPAAQVSPLAAACKESIAEETPQFVSASVAGDEDFTQQETLLQQQETVLQQQETLPLQQGETLLQQQQSLLQKQETLLQQQDNRGCGVLVVFIDAQEWQHAKETQQQVSLLRSNCLAFGLLLSAAAFSDSAAAAAESEEAAASRCYSSRDHLWGARRPGVCGTLLHQQQQQLLLLLLLLLLMLLLLVTPRVGHLQQQETLLQQQENVLQQGESLPLQQGETLLQQQQSLLQQQETLLQQQDNRGCGVLEACLDYRVGGGVSSASSSSAFGCQWPLSEVCLWVRGAPLVLQAEAEGLRTAAGAPNSRRNFNTGYKYLLLRAFRAMGIMRVRKYTQQQQQQQQVADAADDAAAADDDDLLPRTHIRAAADCCSSSTWGLLLLGTAAARERCWGRLQQEQIGVAAACCGRDTWTVLLNIRADAAAGALHAVCNQLSAAAYDAASSAAFVSVACAASVAAFASLSAAASAAASAATAVAAGGLHRRSGVAAREGDAAAGVSAAQKTQLQQQQNLKKLQHLAATAAEIILGALPGIRAALL